MLDGGENRGGGGALLCDLIDRDLRGCSDREIGGGCQIDRNRYEGAVDHGQATVAVDMGAQAAPIDRDPLKNLPVGDRLVAEKIRARGNFFELLGRVTDAEEVSVVRQKCVCLASRRGIPGERWT